MARTHNLFRRFILVMLSFVTALGLASPLAVRADTPAYIIADPNPVTVPFGSDSGLTNVTYNTGDGSIPEIYANEGAGDGGAIIVRTSMGTVQLSVKYGVQNVLKLYSKGKQTLLASVVVTTVRPAFTCDAACRQALGNILDPTTLTLRARDVTSHYWYHDSLSGIGCLAEGPGVASGGGYDFNGLKAAGEVVEGYSDWYKPGTDPFPCEEVDDIYYRGAVNFDLGVIRQYAKANAFKHATLSFQMDQTNTSYDVNYCLAHLEGNALSWNGIDLGKDSPLESGFALNGDHVEADVLSTVMWSLLSDSSDLNFLLIGSQEGFPQNNDRCSTTYRNFTLKLTL
jgi:hypothetical protein